MRFQLTPVLDAIEQRLTTDVIAAQAVVDLGEVARQVALDHGRPVTLVRIGMVVDALSRYLVDAGAMLYGVVGRDLLSESALTSKERMVLGRWADDGVIEVAPVIGDRVLEVADLTGLPLIALRPFGDDLVKRYAWLGNGSGRVLRLLPRAGVAALSPLNATDSDAPGEPVVGRASVPQPSDPAPDNRSEPAADRPDSPDRNQPDEPDGNQSDEPDRNPDREREPSGPGELARDESDGPEEPQPGAVAEDQARLEPDQVREAEEDQRGEAEEDQSGGPEQSQQGKLDPAPDGELDLPMQVFAVPITRTRISWRRFLRGEPDPARAHLLRRAWRCDAFECPAFGEWRRIGQPVPRLRAGVPICPRHDQPVRDIGPRPPAYSVSIVVDDLPRRRLVVRSGQPVSIGRVEDDEDVVSVAAWLHQGATDWISPVHLRLEACDDGLVAFDVSDNGTVVWQRKGPDDPGTARPLHRESYTLAEWDSVELYTGIELMRGDRRRAAMLGRDELASVLVDAPTAAHHELTGRAG